MVDAADQAQRILDEQSWGKIERRYLSCTTIMAWTRSGWKRDDCVERIKRGMDDGKSDAIILASATHLATVQR